MRENIYGACVSGVKCNEKKAEEFLMSIRDTSCRDIVEDYFKSKEAGNSLSNWLENFSSKELGRGPGAVMAVLIRRLEGIDVSYSNLTGSFVGLLMGMPWNFNEKTRSLSEEEFRDILSRYISYFIDEEEEIRLWYLSDGCGF